MEQILKNIFQIFTTQAKNGAVDCLAEFVPLVADNTPAKTVYISNTSGGNLLVRQGDVSFILPDGAIFPFNNVGLLKNLSVKTADDSGATVTFRYEH